MSVPEFLTRSEWWAPVMSRAYDVVVWDLDSTVFDTSHRKQGAADAKAGLITWDDYSMLCAGDVPVPGSAELMRMLAPHAQQVAVSGRSDCALDLTWELVCKYQIPLDEIILRPPGDTTENGLFKVGHINRIIDAGRRVRFMFEDWGPAAELVRSFTGVPVMVVNPCYPEAPAPGNPL